MKTRYEKAAENAKFHLIQANWNNRSYEPPTDQVKHIQKHIFAKWIVNGEPIEKRDGKFVIHKVKIVRNIP